MLLGGLVGYAAFQALVLTGINNNIYSNNSILGDILGDIDSTRTMFVGIGAFVGAIM